MGRKLSPNKIIFRRFDFGLLFEGTKGVMLRGQKLRGQEITIHINMILLLYILLLYYIIIIHTHIMIIRERDLRPSKWRMDPPPAATGAGGIPWTGTIF